MRGRELRLGEAHLLALPLDLLRLDHDRARLARGIEQRLALHSAGVHEHQGRTLGRVGEQRLQLRRHVVGAVLQVVDHDHRELPEQRRARVPGDHTRSEPAGRELANLGVRVGRAGPTHDVGHRAVAEQLLGPGHQGDRRDGRAGLAVR